MGLKKGVRMGVTNPRHRQFNICWRECQDSQCVNVQHQLVSKQMAAEPFSLWQECLFHMQLLYSAILCGSLQWPRYPSFAVRWTTALHSLWPVNEKDCIHCYQSMKRIAVPKRTKAMWHHHLCSHIKACHDHKFSLEVWEICYQSKWKINETDRCFVQAATQTNKIWAIFITFGQKNHSQNWGGLSAKCKKIAQKVYWSLWLENSSNFLSDFCMHGTCLRAKFQELAFFPDFLVILSVRFHHSCLPESGIPILVILPIGPNRIPNFLMLGGMTWVCTGLTCSLQEKSWCGFIKIQPCLVFF